MKKQYENLDNVDTRKSFRDLMQWQRERMRKKKDLSFQVARTKAEIQFLQSNKSLHTITWIGHSTFLIQLNGINIITDPVWANWLGTAKRLTAPGMPIDSLPEIDIVLISHSHYDHLHYRSIKRLKGSPTFFIPDGLGSWFQRKGYSKISEFNWWDEINIHGIRFAFVPAQHWTKRTLTDTNRSHWGGWVIGFPNQPSIYFAGDSGYFRGFKKIGNKYKINYCLMPIGAYEPEWFMADQHVSPEEAVRAFIDTKAQTMIPMHFGAYRLADDTPKEALDRLQAAWLEQQLKYDQLKIMKIGETIKL